MTQLLGDLLSFLAWIGAGGLTLCVVQACIPDSTTELQHETRYHCDRRN